MLNLLGQSARGWRSVPIGIKPTIQPARFGRRSLRFDASSGMKLYRRRATIG